MIQPEKLFENFFDDTKIINVRLSNFASDCLNRLTQNNDDGSNSALIALLTPPLSEMQKELGEVATALSVQKGKTLTVDNFVKNFKKRMSDLQGAVAYQLGGYNQPSFLEFYPQGLTEYTNATKPKMPVLITRIKTAATKYDKTLSEDIANELKAFEDSWIQSRDSQQQTKGSVSENRTERSTARKNVELALCKIIHNIADRYTGDVQQCMSYFDFSLLVARKRGKDENGGDEKPPTP